MKADNPNAVKELTRMAKSTGLRYTRAEEIESQIVELNKLKFSDILQRVKLHGKEKAVKSEALVYLIRDSTRPETEREKLLVKLLDRCMPVIRKTLYLRQIHDIDEICQDIMQEFALLFAEDWYKSPKNELDYYECRFNHAFKAFINYQIRAVMKRNEVEPSFDFTVSDEAIGILKGNLGSDSEFWKTPIQDLRVSFNQLLKKLTNDEKETFVLCKIMGYTQNEASEKLQVSDRTIRNRLDKINGVLEKQNEEPT